MDQFSAHLDRGWELISRNDPRGAEASARRALEIDPQSPEAYNLLGYCAALEGNAEEAVEAYRQAIALDDTYFEAMLNAAEVYIHPMRDFREAVRMCDQALELAETDEEVVDALLLKFDALLGQGDTGMEEARELLDRMPSGPYENPAHTFLVGRAFYEVGDVDRASPLIEEAATKDPKHAEAWYYLGLLRDERGDASGATSAFLRSRDLDLALAPPPWSPSREEFARLVKDVISELDSVLGAYVRQADVFVSDVPGIELVADGVDPRALLLFDGINLPDLPGVPCARIFVYQRNVERLAGSMELLSDEVRAALEREITVTFLESDAGQRSHKELNLALHEAASSRRAFAMTDQAAGSLASKVPDRVIEICRRLDRAGKKGWIVGGSVRDMLRGMAVADYDVATDALPEEVQKIFPRVIPTGIEHGTVTVLLGGEPYELTTLRGETTYSDGRRPDAVVFHGDIEADLARRDFTVNAIALDPLEGRLIDPFGGRRDLEAKVIRAVGDARERFAEDGLRVLRAARFVATLEARLEEDTEKAIPLALDTYRKVSAERVREEWLKTMKARAPSQAFEVMRRTGILGVSCPEMTEGFGMMQNKWHSFDVWGHAMACLDACTGDVFLRVAAFLHDVGKPRTRAFSDKTNDYTFYEHERIGADMAEEILLRLRFSNEERARIVSLVRNHLICYDDEWSDAAVRRWIRRVGNDRVDDLYALANADALGKGRPVEEELAKIERLKERARAVIAAGDALTVRSLAVRGNDLIAELGMKPGRDIGRVLEQLLEHVLDHPADNTRDSLLARAREILAREGS
jgi:tRNA nucleotidyltransferase (CCA-adding enzyme)